MFRLAVDTPADRQTAVIRCMRAHIDIPIRDLKCVLNTGKPIFDFRFHDIGEIRKCRTVLRDLTDAGATLRVFEQVEGFGEREESIEYLRNVMRRNVQIAKEVREQIDREVSTAEG